jgi:hypothetical protein
MSPKELLALNIVSPDFQRCRSQILETEFCERVTKGSAYQLVRQMIIVKVKRMLEVMY